jgi:cell division protein FtsI/penicillin-binding protein 2
MKGFSGTINNPLFRLWLLTIFIFILLAVLLFRLADLQIVRSSYFTALADSQRLRAAELAPQRGRIYFQEKQNQERFPAAVNGTAFSVYSVPRDMKDPLDVAERLAPALLAYRQRQQNAKKQIIERTGQKVIPAAIPDPSLAPSASLSNDNELAIVIDELYQKFNQRTDPYEPLLKFYETIDQPLQDFLKANDLPGIVMEEKNARVYPESALAAHLLGYIGWDDNRQLGRYGIEGFFEKILRGHYGFFSGERDARGQHIGIGRHEFQPPRDGSHVILTVDRVIQSIIESELAEGVNRYGAERGSLVVMNPATGAILGMATYPTFDPNYYHAITHSRVHLNPVISELFEPGSVLKPIIMAAAIDLNLVRPDSTFLDNGPVRVAEYTINTFDGKHHGLQTMTQILEQSNNVGMVSIGQTLGAENTYDYLRKFGFGEKTGVELEGETQSLLQQPKDWDIVQLATTAFGQGVAVTPIQTLNAINTIANGGILMQPHIVSHIEHSDGTEEEISPTSVRRVINDKTAAEVSAMMVSVIENGVATLARVPGYYLAGKTGTAQVPDERGKYSPDKKIISFVGFGPASNPQFSIMIKLDNPRGLSFASGTAAPMFRNVSAKLLQYYQISPDYNPDQKQPRFQLTPAAGQGT